jgi:hypothetical protein
MKVYYSNVLKAFLLMAVLFFSTLTTASCNIGQKEGFVIYLTESGEIILTENEIEMYDSDENALELNENGIKKWNAHLTYQDVPRLADSLFSREFVLEIEGKNICRGAFWSGASSTSYSGVVILDSLFKLDSSHNTLWIKSGYPNNRGLELSISSELYRFFEIHNLLK